SRRRHTRCLSDWSSDVCSSDLSKERGAKPIKLGQKMSEGAAISKKSLKIAFSQLHEQAPDLAPGTSRLIVAELELSGGVPKLIKIGRASCRERVWISAAEESTK